MAPRLPLYMFLVPWARPLEGRAVSAGMALLDWRRLASVLHMPPWKRHKSRVAVSICQTATGFVAALFATMRSSTPLAVRMRVAVPSDACGHRRVFQVALAGGRVACLQASALCTHLTAFPLPLFLAPLMRDRRASVQPGNACNQLLGAPCRAQEAVVNATQRAKQAGAASLIRQLPKKGAGITLRKHQELPQISHTCQV